MLKHTATWTIVFASLVSAFCGGTSFADSISLIQVDPTGNPISPVNTILPVNTITGVPPTNYSAGAFATSLTYGSDGLMYVWDGQNVYQQTTKNGNAFAQVGTAPFPNSARSRPDQLFRGRQHTFAGQRRRRFFKHLSALPSLASYNGLLFALPAPSPPGVTTPPVLSAAYAGTLAYNFSAIPVPKGTLLPDASNSYFVDYATANFGSSQVAIFDAKTGTVTPVITGIPGASTSLTIDSSGRLYVGIGYAYGSDPTGKIETFSVADLVQASQPIAWSDPTYSKAFYKANDGNDYDTGNGMFVDAQGYFFTAGGNFGVAGGLTMISPQGVVTTYAFESNADQDPSIAYNPLLNQFALTPYGGVPEIFDISEFHAVPAPEPTTFVALISAGLMGVIIVRRRRCVK